MAIIECVPNISEGTDLDKVKAIVSTAEGVPGATLISCESDADHNRTVITLAGTPEGVSEAAFNIYVKARELIDLNQHQGEHPRMGAVDVCPFIPVKDATMDDCVELAKKLGERVGRELELPVYLYEAAAQRDDRRNLAKIRRGQFEKLKDLIGTDENKVPDYGPNACHPTFGCTAIGARFFLIAYNVNLDSDDVELAKEIGKTIREKNDGMPGVKSMGFSIEEDGKTYGQVSMNLVDYRKTSPAQAYARIEELAAAKGVKVRESEIVGVIPQEAMNDCAAQALKVKDYRPELILENNLGDENGDGDYFVGINAFLDDLASAAPTPGGGAAAAILGAIGCSLSSMVANLTVGKKKYKEVEDEARSVIDTATDLRMEMINLYHEDVAAFDAVSAAFKLPKATDEEKASRTQAIQDSLKGATITPMKCARAALQGLDLARAIAQVGNTNAISDAGVSALALHSAVLAATLNMRINIGMIKDELFADEHRAIMEKLESNAAEVANATREIVLSKI